jgi:hypothetical protein
MLTPSISEANQNPGSQTGSQRRQTSATQGDTKQRLIQLAGASGDGRRSSATVKLRLTGEGSLVRTQLCLPGHRVLERPCAARGEPSHGPYDSHGGRFGQAPRAWRRCRLPRGGQDPKPLAEPAVPVSRHGLSNLQAADSAARLASIRLATSAYYRWSGYAMREPS